MAKSCQITANEVPPVNQIKTTLEVNSRISSKEGKLNPRQEVTSDLWDQHF